MIAGLLLAAGRSRRFGGNKLLAPLGGQPVIAWSADALIAAVDCAYVVVPPDSRALREALHGRDIRIVEHAGHDGGMGTTIAAGVLRLPVAVQAVIVALGDQPLVRLDVVQGVIAQWRRSNAAMVAPIYRGGRGHPVLFDRRCFAALSALRGDEGARALVASGADLQLVPVEGDAPRDVDTPEALAAVARSLSGSGV